MSSRPFDDDGYLGYDPRLASRRFESFSNFDADSVPDSPPVFCNQSYGTGDDVFVSQPMPETHSPVPIYGSDAGYSSHSTEQNGKGFDGEFGGSDRQILPPPEEMEAEGGAALREWRRQNAIRLGEKEKKEKEMLQQIIKEAEEYKVEFYKKRVTAAEKNKASNREKEKNLLENMEKFHAEAEKNYWKAIAELVPNEVPTIEKRGKKDKEKKPSIVVIQGPKPGKPTDLSRMRQILVKLKHNPPPHMKPKPPAEAKKDAKTATAAASTTSGADPGAPPPKTQP
ncbi:Clathrin light chain 3 [Hibiscus syriacus]|uniref:Clathrin light chain n=1 Tax=Hibiscus syriacus TaxID=106335 RepID=A0A6A2ZKD6_HIBSY|nr:clathrin light chain 3-like [Hibiscus syriacus]KAE8692421.1 Clathrin light chain 3 [Hibiscus syriacus]